MTLRPKPIIVKPDTGPNLNAFGNPLTVLLGGGQTGGKLSVMSELAPPGGGAPLHVNSGKDGLFLVIDGRISYFTEGHWTEVGPGGAVYLPRRVEHCYRNVEDTSSRHWIITTPAGFEEFFARCAEEFAKTGNPDPNRIVEIHHEHGIELLGGEHP